MRPPNAFTLIVGLLLLNGCAAVGVVETSDPYRKLGQAYWLMDQCRTIPAERITGEALEIYKAKNDEIGMAETYHTFGNLYKNKCYHGKNEKYLLETAGSHEKAYEKSEQNFIKAAQLYEKHNDLMGLSKSYFGVGNVAENKQKACEYYDLSLRAYSKGKSENPNAEMPILTGFKDMPEMIQAFKRQQGC